MQTTTTTPTIAREVERVYDVALNGNLIIRNVRLRYTPGDEPADRLGDEARRHAAKRAAVLARRKGKGDRFDLADAGVVAKRESLVPAREVTDKDLTRLEQSFAKPTTKAQPQPKRKQRHGRNGYSA